MLTYELKKTPALPLYEALYRCIREDILSGRLPGDSKLPSKRALAQNLEISKITVEGAYNQLLAEGYIRSVEKVGYFVEPVERPEQRAPQKMQEEPKRQQLLDLTGNGPAKFPFTVWSKLHRQVMLDLTESLLLPMDNQGILELRQAIARHLGQFRGLYVSADNILVGAGTDFLYNLLIQLLGRDKCYAVEEPGYGKIRKIYAAGGCRCVSAKMDSRGVDPKGLSQAQVLHISPAHHFPTGRITDLPRRKKLLEWMKAKEDRYIIEDDYDSEFRFNAHPMPTLASMDTEGRVVYMNTFSKTLAPSIRISYMVLPEGLMKQFRKKLGFYSCTVPSFEQHTLARFLEQGYFEKHINRMRKFYRSRRDRVLTAVQNCSQAEKMTILEEDAGLHFLIRVQTELSDAQLVDRCTQTGIRIRALSSYYFGPVPENHTKCLIVNYSGLTDSMFAQLEDLLEKL